MLFHLLSRIISPIELRRRGSEESTNKTESAVVPPTRKYMGARCFTKGKKFGLLKNIIGIKTFDTLYNLRKID